MTRTRTLVALAAASVLPLAACGDSGGDDAKTTSPTTSETSSETTSETSEPTTEPTSETSEPSETSETSETGSGSEDGKVTSAKAGVSFEVPEDWKVVDPKKVLDGKKAPKELEDMAKAQGMSVDQFMQQIAQQTDVIVFGQQKGKFTSNVNVVAMPSMPTEAQLKSQLESIKAKVEKTEEVDTPLGKAIDGTYTLAMGGQQVHGRMIVAPTDKGAAVITVSTGSAKDAAEVADIIIPSLGKA